MRALLLEKGEELMCLQHQLMHAQISSQRLYRIFKK